MPPSPSAISLVCSTRLAGGACTNEVRQIFKTFGNPLPTCPLFIVPTRFSRFLLSDLVQTSYVMPLEPSNANAMSVPASLLRFRGWNETRERSGTLHMLCDMPAVL